MAKGKQSSTDDRAALHAMREVKLRCLDEFRQSELETWELADLIAEDVRARDEIGQSVREPRGSGAANTGIGLVVQSIALDLGAAGVDKSASYIKEMYQTADAWPAGLRFPPEQAPFTAHRRLRAAKYTSRRDIMAKLITKNGGLITQRHVTRWVFEQQPPKRAIPLDQDLERQVQRASARILGRDPARKKIADLAVAYRAEAHRLDEL